MPITEQEFQKKLIDRLQKKYPSAIILKNDPTYLQGFLDIIVLFRDRWAALEVKKSYDSPRRPNQAHWVTVADRMSFGAFVHPGNVEEIIDALQDTFGY